MLLSISMKAYLCALVTIVAWALAFPGITEALKYFSIGHTTLLRFLTASSVYLVVFLVGKHPLPDWKDLPAIAAISFVGVTIYHICLNTAQTVVPAGTSSMIIASIPIWVALLASLFGKEKLRWQTWLCLLLSFIGIAIIIFSRTMGIEFTKMALLIVVSAICAALIFVFQKPFQKKYGGVRFSIYFIWIGTIPMLFYSPGVVEAVANAPLRPLLAILYVGTFPLLVYIPWFYALEVLKPTVTSSFLNLIPVFSVIFSWMILGEIPRLMSVFGGFLAILGVFLLNLYGKRVAVSED